MEEFLIQSTDRGAKLLFFDRTPSDREQPIETYSVRVADLNLSAAGSVAVFDPYQPLPTELFTAMAQQWQGWTGELQWESLDRELALHCTHDRRGHIRIGIRLNSRLGLWDFDWEVRAALMVEAGQLERLARHAAAFFGRPGVVL